MANHSLTPGEVAQLDQAYEGARADLDRILADAADMLHTAAKEDGVAIALTRYAAHLMECEPHHVAGLTALAIGRLVGVVVDP